MNIVFYLSALLAIFSTIMVISLQNAVHALLYFILSLFSVAVAFFAVGANFVGALEIIVYAGAIMVLFIFVVMLLNIGPKSQDLKSSQGGRERFILPAILALILLGEVIFIFTSGLSPATFGTQIITPKQIGFSLFTDYTLGVELASLMLTAGLVGAYHIGRRSPESKKDAGTTSPQNPHVGR